MKKILIILTSLILNIFSTNYINCQGTVGCRIDCYQNIQGTLSHIEYQIPNCQGCVITIQYVYRNGICNGVPIRTIEIIDASWNQSNCKDCYGFNNNLDRIKTIIIQVLRNHIWPDMPDDGQDFVLIKYPHCGGLATKRRFAFCDDGFCCSKNFLIKKIKFVPDPENYPEIFYYKNQILVQNNIDTPNEPCPIPPPSTYECENICDQLLLELPIYIYDINLDILEKDCKTIDISYQNEKLNLINFREGYYHFNVYNILGQRIYNKHIEVAESFYSIDIEDLNFIKGYIYFIILKGTHNNITKKILYY